MANRVNASRVEAANRVREAAAKSGKTYEEQLAIEQQNGTISGLRNSFGGFNRTPAEGAAPAAGAQPAAGQPAPGQAAAGQGGRQGGRGQAGRGQAGRGAGGAAAGAQAA